jgi:hypothetical protein
MQKKFEEALADINLAQSKEEVKAIEAEIRLLLDSNPSNLVRWVDEIERLTPVATETIVDMAGHYLNVLSHNEALEKLLEFYCSAPNGWVRTKAKSYLAPEAVSVKGYRHGDRVFRNLLRPGFSVNLYDLKHQDNLSLVVGLEEDWKEVYAGSFCYHDMEGQFLYLRLAKPDGKQDQGVEGWLGIGRLFEPGRSAETRGLEALAANESGLIDGAQELAEAWANSSEDGCWRFHAEGSLLFSLVPDIYVQNPSQSILDKLPPLE